MERERVHTQEKEREHGNGRVCEREGGRVQALGMHRQQRGRGRAQTTGPRCMQAAERDGKVHT